MTGMVCCAANDSVGAASTLSTKWTRLTYHAQTKRWAVKAWGVHLDWVKWEPQAPEETPPQTATSPVTQFQSLFGQQSKQPALQQPPPTSKLQPSGQSSKPSTDVGGLGAILAKIIEVRAESSLHLHQNLLENIQFTGAAVGVTGTTRDARLSKAKLRILQACAGQDDGLLFTPSKLYVEVDRERGTTDAFGVHGPRQSPYISAM